jgi:hypothetical protein
MLVLAVCTTAWLEPAGADRVWAPLAAIPENADPTRLELGFRTAGLSVVERIELRSEWRESPEASGDGRTSRQLLRAAQGPRQYAALSKWIVLPTRRDADTK